MSKVDLVILPFHDYKKWIGEGFRTRDAHLFQHFKENESVNKLLVVNRPVSLAEVIIKRRSWKTSSNGIVIYKEKNWQIVKVDDKSFYLDIFLLDTAKVAIERKKWWYTSFNKEKTITIINKACEILNLNNRYVLLQNPMAVGVIGKLNEKRVAFDAIDNWLYHPQNKRYKELLEYNYKLINRKANIIFTVSESLKEMFNKRQNVYCISNGVDKDYFSKSVSYNKEKKDITIGYVGKIQERVDFKLIEKCLTRFKSYNFVFLGPVLSCNDKVKSLTERYKNISFLGDIHYDNLPLEMKKINIAIIPHVVNEFTNSMNPLKLYEYLAAGKPIVTTKVAGVDEFEKYVYISNDHENFLENLQNAIEDYKSDDFIEKKVADILDDKYTWKYKANLIVDELIK